MNTMKQNGQLLFIADENTCINNEQDILDLMATAQYLNCDGAIVKDTNLHQNFFDLKTRFAGNILQKLANYRFKIGIVGDFSVYDSKNLQAFIFECNKGRLIFFKDTVEDAACAMTKIKTQ